MRQAITTRFMGPTNHRGSRVKAMASAGSVTLDWNHALNSTDNHKAAAMALAAKYDWPGHWVCGCLPEGNRDYAVYVDVTGDYGDGFTSIAAEAV